MQEMCCGRKSWVAVGDGVWERCVAIVRDVACGCERLGEMFCIWEKRFNIMRCVLSLAEV